MTFALEPGGSYSPPTSADYIGRPSEHGHYQDETPLDAVYRLLEQVRPWWHKYAMCRGMAYTEPDLFFPERGDWKTVQLARRICQTCPVRQQCLDDALEYPDQDGVRGGLSGRQRRRLRNNKTGSRPPRDVPDGHGTIGGYARHHRHFEKPCRACVDAHNTYKRGRAAAERSRP